MKKVKMYKVTCYVWDLNGDAGTAADVRQSLGRTKHPEFLRTSKIEETEIEYDDSHPTNQCGVNLDQWWAENAKTPDPVCDKEWRL